MKVAFKELSKEKTKKLFDSVLNKRAKSGTYKYEGYHIRISSSLRISDYNKYMRIWYSKNRDKYNKKRRLIYRQRLKDGLCGRCGKINTSSYNKCIECRGNFLKK